MARRLLTLVALGLLVLTAGCSQDVTANVVPEVDGVDGGEAGPYDLSVTVSVEASANATVASITLVGYDLTGEPVCTATVGDVADTATTTLSCASMPSLVLTATPDRGHEIGGDGDAAFGGGPQTVVTGATLYAGRLNGSHRFVPYTDNLGQEQGFRYRNDSLTITDSALRELRCRQRYALDSGANFSALGQPPWLNGTVTTTPGPTDTPTDLQDTETPGQRVGTVTETLTQTESVPRVC